MDDEPHTAEPVRRDSIIVDVLRARPDAARVLFEELGLPCYGCELRWTETLEVGVRMTGLDPDAVVARLNACPPAPTAEEP